jgi:glycosyltransferase involved in cell wall biosynthesis
LNAAPEHSTSAGEALASADSVSVIVVVRNGLATIRAAITSVIEQTHVPTELIVVDGASTDGTSDVLRAYGSAIACLICEPDHGIYDAMMKGIRVAKGEWLLFLGADDALASSAVLREVFARSPRGIPSDIALIYGQGRSGTRMLKNSFDWRMLKGNSLNHQCVLYRRKILQGIGYDTTYRLAADYKVNLYLYLRRAKALSHLGAIADFGSQGASSRELVRGRLEENRVRRELLGPIASAIIGVFVLMKDLLRMLFRTSTKNQPTGIRP